VRGDGVHPGRVRKRPAPAPTPMWRQNMTHVRPFSKIKSVRPRGSAEIAGGFARCCARYGLTCRRSLST